MTAKQQLIEAYKAGVKRGIKMLREFSEDDYYDFQIPAWAVGVIEYGEAEGDDLTDEEIEMAQKFSREYEVVEWGEGPYFSRNPAFGLPCDVLDCKCIRRNPDAS